MIRFQITSERRLQLAKWLLDRPILVHLAGFSIASGLFVLSVLILIISK